MAAENNGWYDLTVTADADPSFLRQFAGHVETGFSMQTEPVVAVPMPTNPPAATNSPPLTPTNAPPAFPPTLSLTNLLTALSTVSGSNPPTLYAACADTNLFLVYLVCASNFVVETSPDLTPGSWTFLNATSTVSGNCIVVAAPFSPASGFFRLRQ